MVAIKGSVFKHAVSGSDSSAAIADIHTAIAEAKALRQKIATAAQKHAPVHAAIEEFLSSSAVKLACAFEAAKKRPLQNRPSLEKVLAIPDLLDLGKPIPEIDRVRTRMKKTGDLRFEHDYGPLHRSAKQMVLRAIEPIFCPRPFQCTFAGLPKTIGQVKAELSAGKVFFATLDIKDHFGSFSTKKLAKLLPIPQEWVDYVVGGRHAVVKIEELPHHVTAPPSVLLLLAQRGLPVGSICSPMIAAYSISFLQWTPGPSWVLLNYADNFLLLASDASVLEEKITELTTAVRKLPGGKFVLKTQSKGQANHGFTFLGHTLYLSKGKFRATPSEDNMNFIHKVGNELDVKLENTSSFAEAHNLIKDCCSTVKGWLAAFAACDDIHEFETLEYLIANSAESWKIDVKGLMQSTPGNYRYIADEYQYV